MLLSLINIEHGPLGSISMWLFCLSYRQSKTKAEVLRRCLQQKGVRTVFKSDTTLRSYLVRPKDALEPGKPQDDVVHKIPCECGKEYIGETGRAM